jgi:hypothetical protein
MSQSISGNFLEFLGFSDYFSCFKVFSKLFLELLMHWKVFRKKRKTLLSLTGRAHGPTLFALAPHPGPARPIWPSSRAGAAPPPGPWPWRACHARALAPRLFKARPSLARPSPTAASPHLASAPPELPASRPTSARRRLPSADSLARGPPGASRRHHEHPRAEPSILHRFPSPEELQSAAAPWSRAAGRIPAAPARLLRRWAHLYGPLGLPTSCAILLSP